MPSISDKESLLKQRIVIFDLSAKHEHDLPTDSALVYSFVKNHSAKLLNPLEVAIALDMEPAHVNVILLDLVDRGLIKKGWVK